MKTVVCASPGRLELVERPIPARADEDVLLRVRRVGVCGTDMHIVRGTQPYLTYPRVMGHELACEVVEAPAAGGLAPGEPVFAMPYLSCGQCNACAKGKPNCCRQIQVMGVHRDGGMAEYITAPRAFVHRTEGLSLDQIAMIEFLAIGAHAAERPGIQPGDRVLVAGAGPIGIAVSLFASFKGARITVLDTRKSRLDFCRAQRLADSTMLLGPDTRAQFLETTQGAMFDVVFDCTGNARAMEAGFDFVAHGGSYVLVSIVNDRISFSDPDFHRKEMSLHGSRNATMADVTRVMDALRSGRIDTAALNTHRATLAQVPAVLPRWMEPEQNVIKAIVEC
jgi:2-desacetyl-2-hydroxyethyl bacteriochlorophyllide A dehydrogenase